MRSQKFLPALALALVAGFVGGGLSGRLWTPVAVEASARAQASEERQWEYCALTKAQYVGSSRGGIYWISYFRGGSVQVVDVEAGATGNAMAKALAKLGEEGWEMVGQGPLEVRQSGPGATPTALYFKRRKG